MSRPFPTDLQTDIQARVSAGGYASEEDLLRDALRALDEDDLKAVKAAVGEWRAGDEGLPLKEAFNEVRSGASS
jgi:Arc/MetJ-type ribon-helix-helix transcriptional regulator